MSATSRHLPDAPKPAPQDHKGLLQRTWLGAVLMVFVVLAAYHNSFRGPFILDDFDSIPENASVRSWRTMFSPPAGSGVTVSGRPVLNASFALNWHVSGNSVVGIHVTNTLIHLLAALVLWGILRRTLGKTAKLTDGNDVAVVSWCAAALWAVHPLQTESVTYMVQRAESLVGLFYLLAVYAFVRAADGPRFWRVVSVVACILGMGTKEVMATAPLVVLVLDGMLISGSFREAWRRHAWLHVMLWLPLLLLAVLVLQGSGRGGSVGVSADVTWWGYVCTQGVAIVRYVWLSLWPASLTLDYGTWIAKDPLLIIACAAAVLAGLGWTVHALVRRRPAGLLGLWFFAILAPSSSVVPVATQTVAEHRMYLPLAALCLGAVLAVRRWLPRPAAGVLAVLVLTAAIFTVRRNETYRTARSIWQDTVAKNPGNSRALNNLGTVYLNDDKDPAAARPLLEEARRLAPAFPEASNNLGQALVKLGKKEEGLAMVAHSVQLAPGNKRLHAGYGAALMDAGDYEAAAEHLRIALSAAPTSSSIHYNLGIALMKLRRLEEAESHLRYALEHEPKNVEVLNNYGTLLLRMGRTDEAIGYFERAVVEEPASSKAYNNLGVAFAAKEQMDRSIGYFREALRLEPTSLETEANLAGALARIGQIDEAIAHAEAVLRRKPDPELWNNLGGLYGAQGNLDKAGEAFRAALALDPNHASARENLAKLEAFLAARRTP